MPRYRATFEIDAPDDAAAWKKARLHEHRMLPHAKLVGVSSEYTMFLDVTEPKDGETGETEPITPGVVGIH